jgi:hypothetical protein
MGQNVHWFDVPDSREGWAEAVELLEVMTYQKTFRDDLLVINFSGVRAKNEPIYGMQGRPSSGPVPLMNAFEKIAKIKGAALKPWLQALYIDHWLAGRIEVSCFGDRHHYRERRIRIIKWSADGQVRRSRWTHLW